MAVLASCDFLGGTAGATVTATTEPFFTSVSGTSVYAAIGDGRMGFRPPSGGTGQLNRDNVNSRSKYGLRWKVKFESSTATTTYYIGMNLRNGATNRSDVGLRNASGARHAAFRNNTAYIGEATGNTMNAGEIWSFETIVDGTTQTVKVWEGDVDFDGGVTPTYSWGPSTLAVAPDNFWTGTASSTGVSAIIFEIDFTDGEPAAATTGAITADSPAVTVDVPVSSWTGSATGTVGGSLAANTPTVTVDVPTSSWFGAVTAPAGTLTFGTNVNATATAVKFAGKFSGAATTRLEVTPSGGGTTVVGSNASPDSAGYAQPTVTGLTAGTAYNYEVFVDGVSRRTGTVKTLPTSGAHKLVIGSCFDSNNSGVFDLMAARNADAMVNFGDLGYTWLSAGAYGNTSPTDEPTLRSHRESTIGSAGEHQDFNTNTNLIYVPSDCDGAGANSDSTIGGNSTGAAQAVYRQMWANPTLPVTGCAAKSWVVGKRRFVFTDETSLASPRADTDNSAKLKLGTAQQTWFFNELDTAAANGEVVIWFGDGPWQRGTSTGGSTNNTWGAYNTNRVAIQAKITASLAAGMRGFIRANGDDHNLGLDTGTNNPWGGFPIINAAPLHTTAQVSGHTFNLGKYPTAASINGARQYAVLTTTEDADNVYIQVQGYSSTSGAPTEVQRFGSASDGSDTDGHTFTFALAVTGALTADTPTVTAAVPTSSWTGTATVPAFTGTTSANTPTVTVEVPTSTWTGSTTVPQFTGTLTTDTPAVTVEVAGSTWTGTASAPGSFAGTLDATTPTVDVAVPTSTWAGTATAVFAGTLTAQAPEVTIVPPASVWAGTATVPAYAGTMTATLPTVAVAAPVAVWIGGELLVYPPVPTVRSVIQTTRRTVTGGQTRTLREAP